MTWAPTPKPDSRQPKCFDPMMGVSPCAMLFVALQPTSKNHTALLHSRPLTTPSLGGKENQLHVHPLFGHLGLSVPTWQNPYRIFFVGGTSACWNTMFLVTSHPSRKSSSSTRRWWTSCAITSQPLRPGPSIPHRRAAVKAGTSSDPLH